MINLSPDKAAVFRAGLADAEVVDRLAYDDDQLRALISEVLPVSLDELASSLGKSVGDAVGAVISAVSGRIQSVRIAARRPD